MTQPPTRIGRFEILKVLGRGAQGVVYLAEDPDLLRLVAVKTLRRRRGPDAPLLDEARTVARLEHPAIVPVYEVGEHDGAPYVVYERIDGRTLRAAIDEDGVPPVEHTRRWAGQILAALACAHDRGIVHRDLKPSNVLIDSSGNARVMDFGIARAVGTQSEAAAGVDGTARYVAPETLRGAPAGPPADIFAAGLVVYEMLTGRHPVDAPDAMSALYQIAHGALDPPSKRMAGVDPLWDKVVMRALERDPRDRFESAAEFTAALEDIEVAAQDGSEGSRGSTFNFLLRRMRRRADFPTLSDRIIDVSRKTASPEQTSVGELSNTILNDYALTTKLLKLVNSSFYGRYGGRISTVSRAVVILGFKQVRMAAQSLLLFEHVGADGQAKTLREAAGRAQMGGILARALGRRLGLPEPEEVFICAMLRNLGRYLTMYYLPEEMADIRRVMSSEGIGEAAACEKVLGLGYERLGAGVAREWQLPALIVESMQGLPPGPLESPASDGERLRMVAAFSTELAEALADGGAGVRAVQTRFADALPTDDATLAALVGEAVADARAFGSILNDHLTTSTVFRAAERFADPQSAAALPAAAPEPEPESEPLSDARDERREAIIDGIQDITNALIEGCSLNDILVMILETVYRGLDFSRVLLCIMDRGRGEMIARFGLGQDIDAILPRFRFRLGDDADPFSRAARTHADVVLSGPEALRTLPPWHRKLATPSVAVVLPIVVKRVCFGLVYCDRADPGARVGPKHLNYLNTLRNQAALAIKQAA